MCVATRGGLIYLVVLNRVHLLAVAPHPSRTHVEHQPYVLIRNFIWHIRFHDVAHVHAEDFVAHVWLDHTHLRRCVAKRRGVRIRA